MRTIGHGGQTLISDATRDLVVDALPADAELRDLGLHRLKDLGRAERIWQLVHLELPHEFPPLRSLGTHELRGLSSPHELFAPAL